MPIGEWPSGLYFARLTAPGGLVAYAPFVLRPRRIGEHRIAVVLPTQTWQAYNFRDDNGDGRSDTWYAGNGDTARLGRPFLDRGVPPHFRHYDLPFLHWIARTGKAVDVLSDADLGAVASGRALAAAYDLVVFPGHHEYVTSKEYDLVQQFRDAGGNLMFLFANDFFWRIALDGDVMTRTSPWRDLDISRSAWTQRDLGRGTTDRKRALNADLVCAWIAVDEEVRVVRQGPHFLAVHLDFGGNVSHGGQMTVAQEMDARLSRVLRLGLRFECGRAACGKHAASKKKNQCPD